MNRSEGGKKIGPPQKNSLDPLLLLTFGAFFQTLPLLSTKAEDGLFIIFSSRLFDDFFHIRICEGFNTPELLFTTLILPVSKTF